MTTTEKIRALRQTGDDQEWYPTTDEILHAIREDLLSLFKKRRIGYREMSWGRKMLFDYNFYKDGEYILVINTFLDVGAGDGRVFDKIQEDSSKIEITKQYGIEIAGTQADDLIYRNVFLIGRDFYKTSLVDKCYSVVFSNPPYSQFVPWTEKLLEEANFGIMYLVLPVRWSAQKSLVSLMGQYQKKILGEFDFQNGDREARAKVNLIRLMHKTEKVEDRWGKVHHEEDDKEEDSFASWVRRHIGTFEPEEPVLDEEQKSLKLKQGEIPDLVENYHYEMDALLGAYKALGKLPYRVLDAINLNRRSILEIIKQKVAGLKKLYWEAAFEKLSAVNTRLIRKTRRKLLNEMEEFGTLDFNEDNIYSIVVWVINNYNRYIADQLLSVFDDLTRPDYISAYKSNVHWKHDDWRYSKGEGKLEKYTLGIKDKRDYRLVVPCYASYWYDDNVIDDFIVVARTLGFDISEFQSFDCTSKDGGEQIIWERGGDVAFSVRHYKNNNAHMRINTTLMRRFNVEVAKLRHWVNGPEDIEREFDVTPVEAIDLWHDNGLKVLGQKDMRLLGFNSSIGGEKNG